MFRVIDKKNQIADLTREILESDYISHYVEVKNDGLLYLNDYNGALQDVKTGKYKIIGKIESERKAKEQIEGELILLIEIQERTQES